jgi:hypothetical protein
MGENGFFLLLVYITGSRATQLDLDLFFNALVIILENLHDIETGKLSGEFTPLQQRWHQFFYHVVQ